MKLTANILKAIHMAHVESCPRCQGQSPCPTEISLTLQWRTAVLDERPVKRYARNTGFLLRRQ